MDCPDCPVGRAASPVISSIPAEIGSNDKKGERLRRLPMLRCARGVFQLSGTNVLGDLALQSSQGTGIIGFRGRDTTMDVEAQLRVSAGGC
jgi:hypothetical protein